MPGNSGGNEPGWREFEDLDRVLDRQLAAASRVIRADTLHRRPNAQQIPRSRDRIGTLAQLDREWAECAELETRRHGGLWSTFAQAEIERRARREGRDPGPVVRTMTHDEASEWRRMRRREEIEAVQQWMAEPRVYTYASPDWGPAWTDAEFIEKPRPTLTGQFIAVWGLIAEAHEANVTMNAQKLREMQAACNPKS